MNLRAALCAYWDRITGVALIIAGALLLVAGWIGVSGSGFIADQLSYLAGFGIGGVLCAGVGGMLLISADLHDEWRKLDRIEAAIRGVELADVDPTVVGGAQVERPRVATLNAVISSAPSGAVLLAVDWTGDRLRVHLVAAGALIAALMAGLGITSVHAHTADLHVAQAWTGTSVAILGVAVAVGAAYLTLMRRRIGMRTSGLLGGWLLRVLDAERRGRAVRMSRPAAASGSSHTVLVVPGLHRYHRYGCTMLTGLMAGAVSLDDVDSALEPCGLCSPR